MMWLNICKKYCKDALYNSNQNLSIADVLIDSFYSEIISYHEAELLKLVLSKAPLQKQVDNLLKFWDIEEKPVDKSLLLAYFMKEHPEVKFTTYEAPRLNGLLMKQRFKNLQVLVPSFKIIKELNKNGILPMLVKGAAMKFLRPDLPRVMGDVDILVSEDDFSRTIEIIKPLGFYYKKIYNHSVDFYDDKTKKSVIDVHKYIHMSTNCERRILSDLFGRAKSCNFNHVSVLLPSSEDMMFITLVNLYKNLRDKTSKKGILYAIFDCKFLVENKKDFNWNIVLGNAHKTKTEMQIDLALKVINRISDTIFPSEIKNSGTFEKFKKTADNNLYMILYNRFYLNDLREKCKPLKIKEIFGDFRLFKAYMSMKPKYLCLKLLRKHPILIKTVMRDLRTRIYEV